MVVATLISAPNGTGLPREAAAELATLVGRPPERSIWLDEPFALDLFFDVPADEPFRKTLRDFAERNRIDCVVQEAGDRRRQVLLADMDSTMIGQECIDELADVVGVKAKVAAITASAMRGEIAFEPALRERVALLEGLPLGVVDEVVADRITVSPGGATLVATMRANGAHTALVSGGFTVFTQKIAGKLGFDEHRANRLETEGERFTGRVAEPILGSQAKLQALDEIVARHNLTRGDVLAVGDGANDLAMILAAGTGVALHAKPAVARKSPHRIDHGDLTALLFVQGYRREEFVRV